MQVIQARFRIEIVPSVAEGVYACHCAGGCKHIPPAVVGIFRNGIACCGIGYGYNVPLQVPCVEVGFCSVIEPYEQPTFVVEEVQAAVACFLPKQLRAVPVIFGGYTVDGFAGTQAGFIVSIACLLLFLKGYYTAISIMFIFFAA